MVADRFVLKQFAGSATNNGAFGAAQATGAGVQPVADIKDVQSLNAFEQGWNAATLTADKLPALEEMQGLEALLCKALKENYSEGIPFWIAGETYFQYSFVNFNGVLYYNTTGSYTNNNPATDTSNWAQYKPATAGAADTAAVADKLGTATVGTDDTPIYLNAGTPTAGKKVGITAYDNTKTYSLNNVVLNIEDDTVKLYRSLVNNNTSPLTDGTKWTEVSLGGGGGEIGDMGFAPLGIDESLNLRRYLNGQVISQTQFVSFTTKVKSAVALFPSLATTEANWQSEKALSKFGQCGKFVIDDDAGTIRLPCVVNAQGLLGLSGIGNLVNESLPNITGRLSLGGDTGFHSNADLNGVFTLDTSGSYSTVPSTTAPAGYPVSFSASSSSSTYQDGAPVQQEAVQYPYYIQVATGVEETLPAIREYEINTPFFFGQSMYSENAPYNASWLVSNGQWNASSVYPDFWTQLTGVELNGSLNVGDTIEISGKTYVKRGLPVVLSTDAITDYDFVVNTADSTFRLPLLNGEEDLPGTTYEDLTLEASGSTYTAKANGIPTITKETVSDGDKLVWLRNSTTGYSQMSHTALIGNTISASIELKKGQTGQYIYTADGATVVFRFIYAVGNGTLYYYVGDTVQDASLINAGAVLGQLANVNAASRGYLVDSFHNGTEWYRIYSDGWIEQSGSVTSNSGLVTYNFITPFKDTNYGLLCSQNSGGIGPQSNGMVINRVSTTQFSVLFTENSTGIIYTWYACGY